MSIFTSTKRHGSNPKNNTQLPFGDLVPRELFENYCRLAENLFRNHSSFLNPNDNSKSNKAHCSGSQSFQPNHCITIGQPFISIFGFIFPTRPCSQRTSNSIPFLLGEKWRNPPLSSCRRSQSESDVRPMSRASVFNEWRNNGWITYFFLEVYRASQFERIDNSTGWWTFSTIRVSPSHRS